MCLIAKEYEHVFVPARVSPIIMSHNNKALKILQYARDEAHRFGVAYNRNVLKRRTWKINLVYRNRA